MIVAFNTGRYRDSPGGEDPAFYQSSKRAGNIAAGTSGEQMTTSSILVLIEDAHLTREVVGVTGNSNMPFVVLWICILGITVNEINAS